MAGSANPNAVSPGMTPAPAGMTPAQPQNVYQQAAQALQGATQGAMSGVGFQAPTMTAAPRVTGGQVGAPSAAGGIQRYMNPYTQQVIDTSMADLERQRQMQMGRLGAQATQAGAFGGSRHGVAEALTNEAFARQGGQLASGLRQQGFQTALGAAQQDAASQLQAGLATAQNQMQANLANQRAAQEAALQNQQAALQAQNMRMSAASQLGNLANLGFGFGQQISAQQMQQGAMQQALQQQLIDAARNQYLQYIGAPQQSLALPLQALGASPVPETTTQSRQPGLFDYLSLAASVYAGSDRRLKTNVKPAGSRNGIQYYTWEWNDTAREIGVAHHPTHGVMADELMQTHPHLVVRAPDGYLRVNYGGL